MTQATARPDMPADLAHSISDKLIDVMTLLHAIKLESSSTAADGITNPGNRVDRLAELSETAVRDVLARMSPYV